MATQEKQHYDPENKRKHRPAAPCPYLPKGFASLDDYLTSLTDFLRQYESISHLMVVDFFTTNVWGNCMPDDWKVALESPQGKLSSLDLMTLVSKGTLRPFESPSEDDKSSEGSSEVKDWPASLKGYVDRIREFSLDRNLKPEYTQYKDTIDVYSSLGMSPKKLHEVEILSGLIASYAKDHSIGAVIDLGAGQGYLSRVLAFQHQLRVLGVDSNTIQTCGAQKTQMRTETLYVKRDIRKKKGEKAASKESGGESSVSATSAAESAAASPASVSVTGGCCAHRGSKRPRESTPTTSEHDITESAKESDEGTAANKSDSENNCSTQKGKASKRNSASKLPSSNAAVPPKGQRSLDDPSFGPTETGNYQLQHITHHITADTLPTLLKAHFPKRRKQTHSGNVEDTTPMELDTKGSDVGGLVQNCGDDEERENAYADGEERWTLCGLHACGDLTSTMIKLYIESSATCLFSVGCCYHWITEKYDKQGNVVVQDDKAHGFPLSTIFNEHKIHLGDHAKMIASQSPQRWLKYQKETEDAIHGHYYRALLHKIMVDRGLYPGPPAVAPVLGRMGKHRRRGFYHYLSTAFQRLKLAEHTPSEEEVEAIYQENLEQSLYRIGVFWAFRTMLGPLFEGLVLLDRWAYLQEQLEDQDEAFYQQQLEKQEKQQQKQTEAPVRPKSTVELVAGFDIVESPRNMILIGIKDRPVC
ncbi:Methyltransferase-like protein 25 [Actinomortierella wolfii]|nr:Methyltransferase-like protein 25 [Actinomortierella wolfii]